jgi:hypothetical protein
MISCPETADHTDQALDNGSKPLRQAQKLTGTPPVTQ